MAFKRSFATLFLLAATVLASPHEGRSYGSSSNKPQGPNSCSKTEFWYSTKECCLPHGGIPKPPSPPPSKSCPPTNWYWHTQKSCCVPNHPPPVNPPPPQCYPGWDWNHATQCCVPGHGSPTTSSHKPSQTPNNPGNGYPPSPPQGGNHGYNPPAPPKGGYNPPAPPKGGYNPPSPPKGGNYGNTPSYPQPPYNVQPPKGGHGYKKRSAAPLCPRSYEACPVSGLTGSEYECLDTTVELRSCGGCASTNKGQDCTSIKGAWNVGCEAGSCAVYTCALGYKVAADNKSCIEN